MAAREGKGLFLGSTSQRAVLLQPRPEGTVHQIAPIIEQKESRVSWWASRCAYTLGS